MTDLVIFQFPCGMGHAGYDEGWFDRVFAGGFSSDMFQGRIYDKGLMKE